MIIRRLLLAAGLLLMTSLSAVLAQTAETDNLPTLRDFESHRITSTDSKGGNDDFRDLAPGSELVLAEIQGPGCIVHIRDNITSNEPHHLQYHVIRMYWDGEKTPSVEAPVGDFFGIGFGFTQKFASALVCIDQTPGKPDDPAAYGAARNCYFPMPFAHSARITITNEGKESSRHWFEVDYRTYTK